MRTLQNSELLQVHGGALGSGSGGGGGGGGTGAPPGGTGGGATKIAPHLFLGKSPGGQTGIWGEFKNGGNTFYGGYGTSGISVGDSFSFSIGGTTYTFTVTGSSDGQYKLSMSVSFD